MLRRDRPGIQTAPRLTAVRFRTARGGGTPYIVVRYFVHLHSAGIKNNSSSPLGERVTGERIMSPQADFPLHRPELLAALRRGDALLTQAMTERKRLRK